MHPTLEEIEAQLDHIRSSPRDRGMLHAIVIRPTTNERKSLTACELSLARGTQGDNWADGCWKSLPDGRPHPDVQIAITNSRVMQTLAQSKDHWPLAGDNLYVDLDLSSENLPPGQLLRIGDAVLQITDVAHNGCQKFAARFGNDALKFVNSKTGKALHLRGVYARVVQDGQVKVGGTVCKLARSPES